MKKYLTLLLISLALTYSARAQYVTITDTTFVNWLVSHGYSGCITGGNQLDTTCNAVLSATTVNCYAVPIHNLNGIQYFKNLATLDCSNDSISFLPSLPAALRSLDCQHNLLTALPALPDTLTTLTCGYNFLTGLPALPSTITSMDCSTNALSALPALPTGLVSLTCYTNNISSLPALPASLSTLNIQSNRITALPALPAGLMQLSCLGNQLTNLPSLPASLNYLDCSDNQLTVIPTLPAGLLTLICYENSLTSLPALPPALHYLVCYYNSLTSLPALPGNLQELYCYDNLLTTLPALPSGILFLQCYNNVITSLPALPTSLTDIEVENNQLTYIPILPDSVGTLSLSYNPQLSCLPRLGKIGALDFLGTQVTCLPDYGTVGSSSPPLDSLPLCGLFNPNGCQPFWNISGQVYYDQNNDCQLDSIDVPTPYTKVQLYSGGILMQQTYTGGLGYYSFDSVANGGYTMQVDTSNLPFTVGCPVTGYDTATITPVDTLLYNNNFSLVCREGFDVGVSTILNTQIPRPNALFALANYAGDMSQLYGAHCAAGISGQVQITFSGPVSFLGVATGALTPTSVNGTTITWNINDFGAVNDYQDFNLLFKIDSLAVPGSNVCFVESVTPVTGDYYPANNILSYCFEVVDAIDPNEKEVYPEHLIDTVNPWLTYTIRFQNTGTAPALNIRITDTLNNNVDPATFTLLAYSARNLTQLNGNAVTFNFPGINLPDSITSDSASRGYIQYKVKLKSNLLLGTTISNTAFVYFDLNNAVVTNTTTDTLVPDTITILNNIKNITNTDIHVTAYPNPFSDLTNIEISGITASDQYNFELYDVTGRLQLSIPSGTAAHFQISRGKLTAGIYTYRLVMGEEGVSAFGKLVVQ